MMQLIRPIMYGTEMSVKGSECINTALDKIEDRETQQEYTRLKMAASGKIESGPKSSQTLSSA